MSIPIKVNHKTLYQLIDYVRNHGDIYGYDHRGRFIESNGYRVNYSSGYWCDGVTIKHNNKSANITRFTPSEFIDGDFYEALKMARNMFRKDHELYKSVVWDSERI